MKSAYKALVAFGMAIICATAQAATCTGRFANPITDICWTCIFPIRIAGATLASLDQEDTPNPDGVVCACGNPPKIGMKVSFWEPVREVIWFKRPVYIQALNELGSILYPAGLPPRPGWWLPEWDSAVDP